MDTLVQKVKALMGQHTQLKEDYSKSIEAKDTALAEKETSEGRVSELEAAAKEQAETVPDHIWS